MKIFLDTHVFLWYLNADARLPIPMRDAIRDAANEVSLSVVSPWEIIIKYQLGKLPLSDAPEVYIGDLVYVGHGKATIVMDVLLHVGFALCFLMIGYGLFAPRSADDATARPVLLRALVAGVLVFCAVWLWLKLLLPLFAWLFWLGDNDHPFYELSDMIAVGVAVLHTMFIVERIASRRASVLYVRIHFFTSAILLLLLGGIWLYGL